MVSFPPKRSRPQHGQHNADPRPARRATRPLRPPPAEEKQKRPMEATDEGREADTEAGEVHYDTRSGRHKATKDHRPKKQNSRWKTLYHGQSHSSVHENNSVKASPSSCSKASSQHLQSRRALGSRQTQGSQGKRPQTHCCSCWSRCSCRAVLNR